MSEVQSPTSPETNEYLVGGGNYTFKPGVNKSVKLKSWSVEKNENNGKTSHYLKLTYVHPQPNVEENDWSTMNELLNFPGFPKGKNEVNKNTVKYGFMNSLTGFIMNFASKDDVNERIKAVFQKLGVNSFELLDETILHTQLETMVKGLFNLVESKGLFQLEGTLICGYTSPREVNGETKQYLQPGKYGTGSVYKPAFRTNNDEELYPEKTSGFTDDTDRKYKYWSYSRNQKTIQGEVPVELESTSVDTW